MPKRSENDGLHPKKAAKPSAPATPEAPRPKRRISKAGIARIIAANKRRWRLQKAAAEAAARKAAPARKKAAVKKGALICLMTPAPLTTHVYRVDDEKTFTKGKTVIKKTVVVAVVGVIGLLATCGHASDLSKPEAKKILDKTSAAQPPVDGFSVSIEQMMTMVGDL